MGSSGDEDDEDDDLNLEPLRHYCCLFSWKGNLLLVLESEAGKLRE